jgi:aminoglycoside phosphotransferase family enzyme/predicted kinase
MDVQTPPEFRADETHVSWLVFTSERVYKIKKPVSFAFLDLRDRSARVEACRREVRLNSRLSPDVYLGVGLFEDPDGATEPVVVMKRLPAAASLSALVANADPELPKHIDVIAGRLADFHRKADRGDHIDAHCSGDALAERWKQNLAELVSVSWDRLPGDDIRLAESLALRFIAGRGPLFERRIRLGSCVDGHGDLLGADVFCLDDGPRILDCLEFSDQLRYVDVVDELASLGTDLERIGRPDLAQRLAQTYRQAAGSTWPDSLEHHYRAYRATVRAKVAGLRADSEEASKLLRVATDHLMRAAVRLVVVSGRPGTGKTSVARMLSGATGWKVLRSDEIRKELAGMSPQVAAPAGYETGIYRERFTTKVYEAMMARAKELVTMGESVILDATFSDPAWQERVARVAEETHSDLIAIRCTAPQEVVLARIAARRSVAGDASDADEDVYRRMTPTGVWPGGDTVVDTTAPDDRILAEMLAAVS